MNVLSPSPRAGFFEFVSSAWETNSGRAIIAANLVPAVGLLFFGWDVFSLVFLYWFENVVIGVYQALRMALAGGLTPLPMDRIVITNPTAMQAEFQRKLGNVSAGLKYFLIPFFCVHYGVFCFGHGLFVMNFFGHRGAAATQAARFQAPDNVGLAMIALIVIHGFIFVKDYVLDGEWKNASAAQLMMEPYGRIVTLHIFIMSSALFVNKFNMVPAVLLAVVFIKTAWDCRKDFLRRADGPTAPLIN